MASADSALKKVAKECFPMLRKAPDDCNCFWNLYCHVATIVWYYGSLQLDGEENPADNAKFKEMLNRHYNANIEQHFDIGDMFKQNLGLAAAYIHIIRLLKNDAKNAAIKQKENFMQFKQTYLDRWAARIKKDPMMDRFVFNDKDAA